MEIFIIVILTLTAYWTIGFFLMLITKENEQVAALYCMGLVYFLAYIIVRPIVKLKDYIKEKRHGR